MQPNTKRETDSAHKCVVVFRLSLIIIYAWLGWAVDTDHCCLVPNAASVFLGAVMSVSQFCTSAYMSGQFGTGAGMSWV